MLNSQYNSGDNIRATNIQTKKSRIFAITDPITDQKLLLNSSIYGVSNLLK